MGGLITCTLLTLIVLPTVYVLAHRLVEGVRGTLSTGEVTA